MGQLFDQTRQPDPESRKPRGAGWRKKILLELEKEGKTEEDFIRHCLAKAFDDKSPLQFKMLEMVIQRLSPLEKSVLPTFAVNFKHGATPADKIDSLIEAVGNEEIPADVAAMLVQMIKVAIEVKELTELVQRLEALEALIRDQQAQNG